MVSSHFIVNICWIVSSQLLGVRSGSRAAHLSPSCACRGHQGRSKRLMVKGVVKHSFRAVPVGEWPCHSLSVAISTWLSLGTMLSCRVQFQGASEKGAVQAAQFTA